MSKEKRLIFTVTPGRSGTLYLSRILKGLPDVAAEHEPVPGFHELLPEARYDAALATRFLLEKKLPYIEAFPEKIYIETSHYFAKGFLDPLLDLGIVPDLILLKRDPRKVACSRFLIGGGPKEFKHMLGPHEPNFLPPRQWDTWNDYQLCFWYALETFCRITHYAQLVTSLGGKTFETYLQSLVSGDGFERLLRWIGMPEDIIQTRIQDTQIRERKANTLVEYKQKIAREHILANLDLDALEAQVYLDCGVIKGTLR